MKTKLRNQFKFKTSSGWQNFSLLTPMLIIILYLGGVSNIHASNSIVDSKAKVNSKIALEDLSNTPKLVRSYSITDANTEDKSCFPTKGKGVIFQRADGCQGLHHIWRVKNDLTFNEYDNDTATIVGSVIDDQGKIGQVNIALYDKQNQGSTWEAACYIDGISDPRSLYQSFNGTINVDGSSFSIEKKESEKHFILAEGAGFEPGQFGFGAWTSGSFGACTEWFGNLNPIEINCKLTVNAGEDQSNCNLEEIVLTANAENVSDCPTVTSKYKVINSNTEVGCFTADPGVIFQKGGSCKAIDYIWSAGDDLFLNEYDNDTATITGTVIDQNGRVGIVDINLADKEHTGKTWNASCYLDGISGPETYYRSFYGTITADGVPVTVGARASAHYILAKGAGFDSSQYGLGAWTGGAFGECTEWFGNLVPQSLEDSSNSVNYVWSTTDGNIISSSNEQTITVNKAGTYQVTANDCKDCEAIDTVVITELAGPTVNAGDDVEICVDEPIELTATIADISECAGGCVYPIERIARCSNASNLSDVWLQNTSNTNKGFVTTSSEFKTYEDGIATYTAIASNGIDNIEVDITFSGYTTIAPQQSPKENNCETYDTSNWVYWTNTSGTIKTEQHGTLVVSRAGPSMQLGNGADVTRTGFGASGWLTISGGDGFYTKGDVNIKLGDCDAFSAVTTVDYLWSTTDGNILGDANQKTISVDKSGTYLVSVADCESCDASDSVVVNIGEVKADAGDDTTICNGEEVTLNVIGEGTYAWSTGETTQTINVSPNATTEYTVIVTNNHCEATDTVMVNVLAPKAHVIEGGVNFCIDGSADYLNDKVVRVSGDIMGANNTFVVTDSDGKILGLPATFEDVIAIDFDGAGLGTCLLWNLSFEDGLQGATLGANANNLEGCFDLSGSIKIIRSAAPDANAGDDVTICLGEETMLTAAGDGSYLWSTGETTASIKVDPIATTTYSVTVTSDLGCKATDEVIVMVNEEVKANAGSDVNICAGDEAILTATGGESYVWSTGETTASITVSPAVNMSYIVTVTSDEGCAVSDDVFVNVTDKVVIGDFVWLDENENGLQDDGTTGINDVTVTLFECNGSEIATTVTADNASGEAGAYSFEVCPNSGYYYVVFENTSELLEFTSSNAGDDTQDSDANNNGITQCFKVEDIDIPSIDAGLVLICDIKVDAGENDEICEDEIVELTADILDDTAECPGGCVYPIKKQDRCYGPTGDFEVYLVSTGTVENFKFVASEQKFERLADNSVRYTATASNGKDVIEVDAMLTGYTQIAPINSPKANACQTYNTSDWEYWTTWSGTITSRDHGVFNLSVKGAAFQMGVGADMVRTGFGASGWFYVEGGDGFYTEGDVNVTLEECVEENISYNWSTEDGNIVGSSNQKTIRVDQPGTYTVEAVNCIDCVATDTIKLVKGFCAIDMKQTGPKMTTVYPVPVKSGGTLTIEFDVNDSSSDNGDEFKIVPLKAAVDHIERKEDVSVVLYNILGQMISAPRTFKVENGKATIYLDLDYIPSGKYILRAQGPTWSDAKNILVE